MKVSTFKSVISTALTATFAYFDLLVIPLIVLFAVTIVDYITGIIYAYTNNCLSSKIGIIGIIKKLGFFIAVSVACVVDWLLKSALTVTGIILPSNFGVAILVCIWLIINDCISILENLKNLGVPLPVFLENILERIKNDTEQKGKTEIDK